MQLLRSARFPSMLLLVAAALGLLLANSPAGPGLLDVLHLYVGVEPFRLSIAHVVQDLLLAVFFFVVAVELRHEFTEGDLRSPRQAVVPAIAAAGGVLLPAVIFAAIAAGDGLARGWPVPTATDIAFALGVLAVIGRGLPSAVRVFLLTLAILDDLAGIVFIAVLFTEDINLSALLVAVVLVALFWWLSGRSHATARVAMVLVALATWCAVYLSGVHATIAGVALGLVCAPKLAASIRHALEPVVNGIILPLFAFVAAAVVIPQIPLGSLSSAFWGVLVALPVGKLVGISVAGYVAQRALRVPSPLPFGDLLAAGALGGIGFTVSLLLGQLAFSGDADLSAEVTLAVLAGSLIAIVLSLVIVGVRVRGYRRQSEPESA